MGLEISGGLFKQTDVRETPTSATGVTDQLAPIGSVMGWLKSLTGTPALPAGWVEANGQTITDGDSAYNGITLPDLNGDNRFLRGNSTSGGTGGADTEDISHTHSFNATTSAIGDHVHNMTDKTGIGAVGAEADTTSPRRIIDADGGHSHTVSGTTGSGGSTTINILPTYLNVVWIIRIK